MVRRVKMKNTISTKPARESKLKCLFEYDSIGKEITIKCPEDSQMYFRRSFIYYPASNERRRDHFKIGYVANKSWHFIDLPATKHMWQFTFKPLAVLGYRRYIIGKGSYVNLIPADSRLEKVIKFVIIM